MKEVILILLLTDLIDIENDTFPKGIDDLTITGISDDSRNIKPGMLFVAISGNKDKGINFVDNAILSGAKAVLCHKDDLDSLHKANVPIITSINVFVRFEGNLVSFTKESLMAHQCRSRLKFYRN